MKTNIGNLRIATRNNVVEFTLLENQKGRVSALLTYDAVDDLIALLTRLKADNTEPNEALDLV